MKNRITVFSVVENKRKPLNSGIVRSNNQCRRIQIVVVAIASVLLLAETGCGFSASSYVNEATNETEFATDHESQYAMPATLDKTPRRDWGEADINSHSARDYYIRVNSVSSHPSGA